MKQKFINCVVIFPEFLISILISYFDVLKYDNDNGIPVVL